MSCLPKHLQFPTSLYETVCPCAAGATGEMCLKEVRKAMVKPSTIMQGLVQQPELFNSPHFIITNSTNKFQVSNNIALIQSWTKFRSVGGLGIMGVCGVEAAGEE